MKSNRLRALSLALSLLLLLLALPSCASSEPLYSVTVGDRVYAVTGGAKPNRITVTQNGERVWSHRVSVKRSVGDQNGTYGLVVSDLNFDGLVDITISTSKDGDVLTNLCFLQTADGAYEKHEALSKLCNVRANTTSPCVLTFSHTYSEDKAYTDAPAEYISSDIATSYIWKDGALMPYHRVALTYYSGHDIYCFSSSDYLEDFGEFYDSDDEWLSPAEKTKWESSNTAKQLYYFR